MKCAGWSADETIAAVCYLTKFPHISKPSTTSMRSLSALLWTAFVNTYYAILKPSRSNEGLFLFKIFFLRISGNYMRFEVLTGVKILMLSCIVTLYEPKGRFRRFGEKYWLYFQPWWVSFPRCFPENVFINR
jgi:hypothetical protein